MSTQQTAAFLDVGWKGQEYVIRAMGELKNRGLHSGFWPVKLRYRKYLVIVLVFTLAVVNMVGSSIAREADKVFYTLAGPEISIATTKAYSAQLAAMYCLYALKREDYPDSACGSLCFQS